jgi:2-oxo-4-hydroxy-4-carboxy-5-ureidoimidazoline decarboxylase
MTRGINELPGDELERELWQCCASARWTRDIAAGRPYADGVALQARAEKALAALPLEEWIAVVDAMGDWPVPPCDEGTRAAIGVALDLYRERFGYRFVSAHETLAGEQLLMRIRIRLGHEAAAELRKSRAEHGAVVCRRVARLFGPAAA